MSGCVAFAKINGSTQVESELLPQMWEQVRLLVMPNTPSPLIPPPPPPPLPQITHKYYERRLLVAESCGVLAPYIPVSLVAVEQL